MALLKQGELCWKRKIMFRLSDQQKKREKKKRPAIRNARLWKLDCGIFLQKKSRKAFWWYLWEARLPGKSFPSLSQHPENTTAFQFHSRILQASGRPAPRNSTMSRLRKQQHFLKKQNSLQSHDFVLYRQRDQEIKPLKIRGCFVGFMFVIGRNYSLAWNFVPLLACLFHIPSFFSPQYH